MKHRMRDRAIAVVTLTSFVLGMFPVPARAEPEDPLPIEAPREGRVPQVASVTETAKDAEVSRGSGVFAPVVRGPAELGNIQGLPAPDDARSEALGRLLEPDPVHLPPDPVHLNPDPVRHNPDPIRVEPDPVRFAPKAPPVADSLPGGVDKTGVSSQVLSLPQGAGKIQGMGESFSKQLSTGIASYTIPISLPGARGGADPSLALSYSSSAGHGLAGVGWEIGVPFISRQTDRGIPLYQDPPTGGAWAPTQDRFIYNGGQELIPICLVTGGSCTGAQAGEAMPAWAEGWQYFRPRVEGSFLRFFWSRDHRTWRVQDKNGSGMELGVPLDGGPTSGTIEVDPTTGLRIFRWDLSRQYDAYGDANLATGTPLPVNVVQYRYTVDGAISYLTDIYDTPPANGAATADISTYAHHTHLRYESRPDATTSYKRGWAAQQSLRLTGIDVASKTADGGTAAARRLVRRYHLTYDPSYHVSLLASVQIEGRCGAAGAGEALEPVAEDDAGLLPDTSNCPSLPPMSFGYTHVTPYHTDGSASAADLLGYEGFDERVISMSASPPNSVDEANTDLFDINSDGLPDVLVTMPGLFYAGPAMGCSSTWRGRSGGHVHGVHDRNPRRASGDTLSTITLSNENVSSGDIDGDGIIDLVHMPQVKTYSVYTPQLEGTQWFWQGRAVTTAAAQSPKINLGGDAVNVQRMDVNGDGLVDVVVSTGTEMETFLSLDRYPGGDGQFGYATWTGPTGAQISNDPIATCVPTDGLPVQLSDGTIKVADMNGDGLPDIVRVQQGDVHYWPGRGNGYWGTGDPSGCASGSSFGQSIDVAMTSSPQYADPNGSALRIDDVNGDRTRRSRPGGVRRGR